MKVTVDLEKCTSQGRCYDVALDVFEKQEDGKSKVMKAHIHDDDMDHLMQAESAQMMCPAQAITVAED